MGTHEILLSSIKLLDIPNNYILIRNVGDCAYTSLLNTPLDEILGGKRKILIDYYFESWGVCITGNRNNDFNIVGNRTRFEL